MARSPHVLWRLEQISVRNTLLPLPLFFIVYDAFYAPFHRALHHRSIYAYVHKHHHRQVVPTRGNTDAINVRLAAPTPTPTPPPTPTPTPTLTLTLTRCEWQP